MRFAWANQRWLLLVSLALCTGIGFVVGTGRGQEALVLVVGAIVLLFASRKPWTAIAGFMTATSFFGNVSIIGLGGFPDLTVTRLLAVWLGFLIVTRWSETSFGTEQRSFISRVYILVGVLSTIGLIAALRNGSLSTGLQLYVDQILVPYALLAVVLRMRVDGETLRKVLLVLVILGVAWSGVGLYEFLTRQSLFAAGGVLLWARESYARVGGPFINPAGLGTAIGIAIAVTVGSAAFGGLGRVQRLAALSVCFVGIAVTLTRGAWVAAALGVLVVGLFLGMRGVIAWMVAGLAAGGVGYVLLQFVGESALIQRITGEGPVFNRLIVYAASMQLIVDNALGGVGLGMFADRILVYMGPVGDIGASYGIGVFAPHNSLLHAAAELGMIGMLVIVAIWFTVARRLLVRARDGSGSISRVIGPAIIVVYLVNAMFIDMWLTQNLNPLVYVLVGVLAANVASSAGDDSGMPPTPRPVEEGDR